ncbi:uncharacterized protein LOC128864101 [Anastrepha ludens]|uniref:uncharacterized protein LOC128864101 n=1 Tax=Anastrepha ludens TaxID=28586 RepID=UPI0023AF74FC|nr:uncharacterized protein LOC128864101 [Anastrepha ludens]
MFLLKLALSLLCATTYTSTTTAANSIYSTCTRDICNCLPGTHEATLAPGLKYCATDSTEKCMEFAVRLSPTVCECKRGYKFNVDRTKCFPMNNRSDDFVDRFRDELSSTATTSFVDVDKTTTEYENNAGNTTTSDGNNSNEVPTEDPLSLATKPELDNSKSFYIWIGVALTGTALLVFLASLYYISKRK